jgi:hypothetical protein
MPSGDPPAEEYRIHSVVLALYHGGDPRYSGVRFQTIGFLTRSEK